MIPSMKNCEILSSIIINLPVEMFYQAFENINTLEKTIELIKQNSRRYAKKQNTWFKKFGTGKTFSEWNDSSIFEYTENSLLL